MATQTALQFKYLIKVEPGSNNNKYYKMQENSDGTWTATYARVGAEKPATEIYPMSKWDSKLKEKLSDRKGYIDQTDLYAEIKTVVAASSSTNNVIADDTTVANLIIALQGYAKANTAKTYLVQAESVTKAQIEKAQKHIDNLVYSYKNHFGKPGFKFDAFNEELLNLFRTIPRKMREIGEFLLYENEGSYDRKEKKYIAEKKKTETALRAEIEKIINDEQSNLDTMASQIPTVASAEAATPVMKQKSLIETLGLKILPITDKKELEEIKTYAQEHSKRVLKAFKFVNEHTQKSFDAHLAKADNKKTELFWHGSRNQNWWWIIQQGLKIRPSNAASFAGSMFGDGMYFASECDKSMGYTDSGRWNHGHSNGRVYMSLYKVHIGKQYVIENSDSSLSASKLERLGKYDSTWGKKGRSLYRNEYIVYNSAQSTIQYLVEFQD